MALKVRKEVLAPPEPEAKVKELKVQVGIAERHPQPREEDPQVAHLRRLKTLWFQMRPKYPLKGI